MTLKLIIDALGLGIQNRLLWFQIPLASLGIIFSFSTLAPLINQDAIGLWGLWIIASVLLIWRIWNQPKKQNPAPLPAIILLGAAACLIFVNSWLPLPPTLLQTLVIVLVSLSLILIINGYALTFSVLTPMVILIIIIPHFEPIRDWMVLVLRIISAHIAGYILMGIGVATGVSGTQIQLPHNEIAVTAACSGIAMFESFICIGWLVVLNLYRTAEARLLHFSLFLPIILLTNSLRLLILIIGMLWFGEQVITGVFHLILGYIIIVMTVLLFLWGGSLVVKE